jgi:uncharacterized protein YdhG (YjbR/CyaY superfamily)
MVKKAKPGARRAKPKSIGGPKTVGQYLSRVPEPARRALERMRATIRSVVPREATEVISYRIPAFKHGTVLVWYAAFANHVSLFPGGAVLEAFEDDLTDFKTSKGTVQFPLDAPLPIALIKRIVKARVEHVLQPRSRRTSGGSTRGTRS